MPHDKLAIISGNTHKYVFETACFFVSYHNLYAQKSHKQKRGKQPIVDGDINSAQAVMPMKITETNNDGTTLTKCILVSLDSPKKTTSSCAVSKQVVKYQLLIMRWIICHHPLQRPQLEIEYANS